MNFTNILIIFCILCSIFFIIFTVFLVVLVHKNPLLKLLFDNFVLTKIEEKFGNLKLSKKLNLKKYSNTQKTKNKVVDKIIDAEFREVITEK